MANKTGAFGLRPVRHINGAPYNGATIKCYISANYGTALFIGDGVIFDTTLANKDVTGKYPTIIACVGNSGGLIRGVIVSFDLLPNNLDTLHNPASTERYANVCVDGDVIFQIRDDNLGTPTKVYPGQNATLTLAAGSTITGLSGSVLDTSTPGTTQAFPLHILGLAEQEDNELATSAIWEVLLNTNENATGRFLGITAV